MRDKLRPGAPGAPRRAPAARRSRAEAPTSLVEEEEFDLAPVDEAAARSISPPRRPRPRCARGQARDRAVGPPPEEDREFIEEHLAEGRVFRKYGLIDKAADQFEAVIARFPDNVDARRELRDL